MNLGIGLLSIVGSVVSWWLLQRALKDRDVDVAQQLFRVVSEPRENTREDGERPLQRSWFVDRLGRAGIVEPSARIVFWQVATIVVVVVALVSILLGWHLAGSHGAVIGGCVGSYLSITAIMLVLLVKRRETERAILLHLPMSLELLLLLVESGLGLSAALKELVRIQRLSGDRGIVPLVFRYLEQSSESGITLEDSLRAARDLTQSAPLNHTMAHLDIAGSEGGALGPALRHLSDYVQHEWRLGVESQVRKLENLVVFPVFIAVIGLFALTAAVPLASVLEMKTRSEVENRGVPSVSLSAGGSK